MIGTRRVPAYSSPVSIEFVLGPAGSGKTYRCLAQAAEMLRQEPEGPPLVFLAPKQATYQIERRLLVDFGLPGFHRLQIVSFERFAEFLLDFLGLQVPEALSDEGRIMVIRSLLLRHADHLEAFQASARGAGFARALGTWLSELQQHHGTPERLRRLAGEGAAPPSLRPKLRDAALIAEEYNQWLGTRGIHDPDLALPLAVEALQRRLHGENPLLGWLWLDGFAELTPAELNLLEIAVRASAGATLAFCVPSQAAPEGSGFDLWCNIRETFRTCHARLDAASVAATQIVLLPSESNHTRFTGRPSLVHLEAQMSTAVAQPASAEAVADAVRVQLWPCPHPEAEAELAAQAVLEHVQNGGRYREVGIVPRTLEGYSQVFSRVFRRHGIPLFIDQRAAMGHHPAIELIRAAFRVLARDWEQAEVLALLKTGLVVPDSSRADRLENAALRGGWERSDWVAVPADDGGDIESARQAVVGPLLELEQALGQSPTGDSVAAALSRLLAAWDVQRQLDKWHLASPESPHNTVWKALESWLGNVRLAFASDALAIGDWSEIFESGFSGLSVGVLPPALDQVLLGTVDRSRNPELKVVIVPGLNDGIFPARPPAPQILGQR